MTKLRWGGLLATALASVMTLCSAFKAPPGRVVQPRPYWGSCRSRGRVVMAGDNLEAGLPEVGPQASPKGFAKAAVNEEPVPKNADEAINEIGAMSPKQRAAFWERQKELEREYDMREIEEYELTQKLLEEGELGYLPEKISQRILKRLAPFIALPVLGGIGLFVFYIYLAKQLDINVPPGLVAATTQIPFLVALAGITYSVMSASWDPDVEGSFWGVDEFKANVINLLDSLQKTKREERAKEKLAKYQEAENPNRAKRRATKRLVK